MLVEAETQLCIDDGKRALLAYPSNAAAPRLRAAVKGSQIKITPVFKFEMLWYIISSR